MLIVLDALGVIFRTRDGWSGHLTRFVAAKGGTRAADERDEFVAQYFACTRGELSTADLWQWCGLDPAGLDQEYVDFFVTTPGLVEFVSAMQVEGHRIACLTNDAAAWSRALRRRHQLDVIEPWVISSDIGARKPDEQSFAALSNACREPLTGALFVDDTETNLDAAAHLGMRTVLFGGDSDRHPVATSWEAVARIVKP